VIGVGPFITVVFNFLILAFVIFWIVRLANRLKKTEPVPAPEPAPAPAPVPPSEDIVLLRAILHELQAQKSK
jgi:large conductance mechanosensitive channel